MSKVIVCYTVPVFVEVYLPDDPKSGEITMGRVVVGDDQLGDPTAYEDDFGLTAELNEDEKARIKQSLDEAMWPGWRARDG